MTTTRLDVERVGGEFDCAQVKTTVDVNGQVILNGYVSSHQDLTRLISDITNIAGVNKFNDNMEVHTEPFCQVIGLLASVQAPQVNHTDAVILQTNKPGNDFKQDELLIVYAKATDAFPGYFYVDSVNSYGEVLHMMPSPITSEHKVDAGQQVTLGNKPCPECYKTSPPHGKSLIVAISSTESLFDKERPEVEDMNTYIPVLRAALQWQYAEGGEIVSTFEYITTHE